LRGVWPFVGNQLYKFQLGRGLPKLDVVKTVSSRKGKTAGLVQSWVLFYLRGDWPILTVLHGLTNSFDRCFTQTVVHNIHCTTNWLC